MFFSENKLRELAQLPSSVSTDELIDKINKIGFEVEGVKPFTQVEGIKFGRVIELTKNPNGDKLTVARLAFDDKERTIQTTASNLVVDNIVIAFVPGSKAGEITFDSKELKGVLSEGMLSALPEFGIEEDLVREKDKSGISTYDVEDLSIDPIEYLGLKDNIIEIDILSNRSDSNSYYVMAMEIAAAFGTNFEIPTYKESTTVSNISSVSGEAKELVYLESEVPFISIQERVLLAKSKIKSVNNASDLSNLTFIMTGQPTHAYDADKVGTAFTTDRVTGKYKALGKEVELDNALVIISDGKPVAVPGVIGFEDSASNLSTDKIIIELGQFPINEVRSGSKQTKIQNQTSSQSGKNLSPGLIDFALSYLSNKLPSCSKPVNWIRPAKTVVEYNPIITNQLAGFEMSDSEKYSQVIESLESLGFVFDQNKVEVPIYRNDITHQQDVDEEIFRFYSYDSFKPQTIKTAPSKVVFERNTLIEISMMGYQEVQTYNLTSEEKNILNPFNFSEQKQLVTYVSKEREFVKNTCAITLLEIMEYNKKRKINNLNIFETSMIANERKAFALASTEKTFNEMKQDVLKLLSHEVAFERITDNNTINPSVSAYIKLNNKVIGWIGKIHPKFAKVDAFIAEVFIDKRISIETKQFSSNPMTFEDITFELTKNEDIVEKIKSKNLDIFDYRIIDRYIDGDLRKITVRFTKEKDEN